MTPPQLAVLLNLMLYDTILHVYLATLSGASR